MSLSITPTPKKILLAVGVLVVLIVGIGIGIGVTSSSSDDEATESFSECVDDAAQHLQSAAGLSASQARLQAESSPRCSPLAPPQAVAAAPVEDSVWPAGTSPSEYARLYEALCRGVDLGVPSYLAIDRITDTQTAGIAFDADMARDVYYDAISMC